MPGARDSSKIYPFMFDWTQDIESKNLKFRLYLYRLLDQTPFSLPLWAQIHILMGLVYFTAIGLAGYVGHAYESPLKWELIVAILVGFSILRWGLMYVLMAPIILVRQTLESTSFEEPVDLPTFDRGEWGRLLELFDDLMKRYQKALNYQNRMLALAAHDAKNPAQAIQIATRAQKQELDKCEGCHADSVVRRMSEIIEVSSKRQVEMVDAIIQMAKSEEGKIRLDKRTESLTEIIEEVRSDLIPVANSYDITLTAKSFADLQVTTDTEKLRQIVRHVTSKSLRNAKGGGSEVQIETHLKTNHVVIRVRNDGKSLGDNELSKLFDPYPEENTSELGLWISKMFTDLLNGKIEASSGAETGIEFLIHLNLEEIKAESIIREEENEPPTQTESEQVFETLNVVAKN